jgi:hypothetical protein
VIPGNFYNHRCANVHPHRFDDRLRESHPLAVAPTLQGGSHVRKYIPWLYDIKKIFASTSSPATPDRGRGIRACGSPTPAMRS